MSKLLSISLLLFVAGSVLYFSWLPNPNIGLKWYFPRWLGQWIDENSNSRTGVPFLLLGALTELIWNTNISDQKRRCFILSMLSLLILIAEMGQLLLPKRHFDPADIAWGITGAVSGTCIGLLARNILTISKKE